MLTLRDVVTDPSNTLGTIRLSATVMQIVIGIILPLVVGGVTNFKDHPLIKGGLQIALSAVSAVIVQWTMVDGSLVFSRQTFVIWTIGLATSLVAYVNAWKPAGLTSSAIQVPGPTPGTVISIPGKLSEIGLRRAA